MSNYEVYFFLIIPKYSTREKIMPEPDKEGKQFHQDVPMSKEGFFLKGCNSLDWGMKNRLARIFNPKSGRTVMLAVDHGYFQGPTTGLERIDLNIVPIAPYADTLMLTRGILRSTLPPSYNKGVVLRASGGPSIFKGIIRRVSCHGHGGCPAPQRLGSGGTGFHRR